MSCGLMQSDFLDRPGVDVEFNAVPTILHHSKVGWDGRYPLELLAHRVSDCITDSTSAHGAVGRGRGT
jgi:hypothetical protein